MEQFFNTPQGEPRAVSTGAGVGRAVIYQDRFDPAAGFQQLAILTAQRKMQEQQAALKKQQEAQKAMRELDFKASDELDLQELEGMRTAALDGLTQIASNPVFGDIMDPASEAGRMFNKAKKSLETASEMSAHNRKILEAQMTAFRSNPGKYDAEEYQKRINYYNSLETISARNAFLQGEIDTAEINPDAGAGLLVERVDLLDPIDGISATEFERLIQTPEGKTKTVAADKARTREVVTSQLFSNEGFARHIQRWQMMPEDKRKGFSNDVEGYIDFLTDNLVNQVKNIRVEEEKEGARGWRAGGYYGDGVRFGFGVQKAGATYFSGKEQDEVLSRLGVSKDKDVAIASIAAEKGKEAPAFTYQLTSEGGQPVALDMKPNKVVKIDGNYYLQGTARMPAGEAERGLIERKLEELGGFIGKGDMVGVPLDDRAGNWTAFETQFDVSLNSLGQIMDQQLMAKQAPKETTPKKREEVSEVQQHLRNAQQILDSREKEYEVDGVVITVDGRRYSMNDVVERRVFYLLYEK